MVVVVVIAAVAVPVVVAVVVVIAAVAVPVVVAVVVIVVDAVFVIVAAVVAVIVIVVVVRLFFFRLSCNTRNPDLTKQYSGCPAYTSRHNRHPPKSLGTIVVL